MMEWSHTTKCDGFSVVSRPVTADRFGDLEAVMDEKAVTRNCFCMYWRRPNGGFGDERPNRDRFAQRVDEGPPPGLIAYLDGEPVGWVQVGPRREFPTIGRSRLLKPVDDLEVWTVNCFVVRSRFRRRGVGHALLEAALAYAGHSGATVVEGYPVDGERTSVVDYYTGTLGMFSRRGFEEIERRNQTRPIVRLQLD